MNAVAHIECLKDGEYVKSWTEDLFNVQFPWVEHRCWVRLNVITHRRLLHNLHPLPRSLSLTALHTNNTTF